jgi:hypothetical protein
MGAVAFAGLQDFHPLKNLRFDDRKEASDCLDRKRREVSDCLIGNDRKCRIV